MKKIIFASLLLFSLLVLPTLALLSPIPAIEPTAPQPIPTKSALDIALEVMRWLFTILLIAAVIAILVGAYHFVTSGGEPEKVKTARNFVLYAVIAIVVAGLAWGLVSIARRIVGGL